MTDHRTEPARPLWTDEDLDRALDALHTDEAGQLGTARATLDDALAHQGVPMLTASRGHDAPPPRPARTRRWAYGAVAAGVAVVAAAAVAFTGPFGAHSPQHKHKAAPAKTTVATVPGGDAMRAAAAKVRTFKPVQPGPGQYLYVKEISSDLYTTADTTWSLSYRRKTQLETWIPYDQAGTWTQHFTRIGKDQWVVGDKKTIAKHGKFAKGGFGEPPAWATATCGDFHHAEQGGTQSCLDNEVKKEPNKFLIARKVPNDPRKFLAWAADGDSVRGADIEQRVLHNATMLLRSGVVSADLESTIYQALAMLPDLKVTERVANLAGKRGIALGIDAYGDRQELILDPKTGQYLGTRIVSLTADDTGVPAGTIRNYSAVQFAVVDKPRERP
ncbi:CU044_5270 family protein [Actinocatenispora sera]|uniref:CU044_5270 family protein n=1 Tax=Actinocatenispora sera TaxID=390989 RepID=A0A810L1T7_9ACTN|nr:CU044_5270 family protein [Actinocatenispora sera]BCJ29373.1 hypothetical protein Asera_34810 [Actinocatenispora sera]